MTAASALDLAYVHVDVFSPSPYGGNSLAVFPATGALSAEQMLRITQELRHFETIFLDPTDDPRTVRARVFDLHEELPFAGHPVIGAAAVLHLQSGLPTPMTWKIELPKKSATVSTERTGGNRWFGMLDQGVPEFLGVTDDRVAVARAFGLEVGDLSPELPLEVVSTGLRYLIVPVRPQVLARARIARDITPMLHGIGASFAVLLDDAALEVRHWNNDGIVEDIATGSAAGTIGAYRLRHGRAKGDETFALHQGRFAGRPSRLMVRPMGSSSAAGPVMVGGEVALVGRGTLAALPENAA